MRGKVNIFLTRFHSYRITPAYAGKSEDNSKVVEWKKDHPRLCGEKIELFPNFQHNIGSPPPMRGKAIGFGSGKCDVRDHPRLCGEKRQNEGCIDLRSGSPPPMRGKAFGAEVSRSV